MNDQTQVAIEIYKGLRQEIVERLKLRDQILLAHLAGVTGLIGFSVKENSPFPLLKASMVLLPFLALAAANSVAQHQGPVRRICG